MIDARVFLKEPIPFKDKCKIYPPSVREVLCTDNFSQYKTVLTLSQEDIEDIYAKDKNFETRDFSYNNSILTPLEFLLNNCFYSEEFSKIAKKAFEFFIKKEVTFSYEDKRIYLINLEKEVLNMTSIQDYEKLPYLSEADFFDFQNAIRTVLGETPIEKPVVDEDPRIRRIKAKARYRDKVKAKQGKGLRIETVLVSICCMGIGLTPLNIGEISFACLNPLMAVYQGKEKYELDIDSLLAGASPKKIKPKYWISN